MFELDSITQLIFQVLSLAALNVLADYYFHKNIVTASSAFWFGWLCLLLGTLSFINNGLMDDFGRTEIYYINVFHSGAFIGFLMGTVLSAFKKKKNVKRIRDLNQLYLLSEFISNKITGRFLNILLVVGLVFFVQRVSTVGLSADYFSDARDLYRQRQFNVFSWLGNHLSVVVSTLITIQGIIDGFQKMNLKKVLKVILFASPLFLANATRTFLIFPLLTYFVSFLVTRGVIGKRLINRKELINFSLILFTMLFVFAIISFLRGGYGESFDLYYTVVAWPVSTSYALESWLNEAINSSGTNGLLTFDWFANFLDRIGFLDYSGEKKDLRSINQYFIDTNNSASVIPRSMLPDLIFDFGKDSLFFIAICIGFFTQTITVVFSGKSLVKHAIAIAVVMGMFMSIQNSLFSPGFVIGLFWIIMFNWFFTKLQAR